MIDIEAWMNDFAKAAEERFGQRVWFVGLQGSYGRGEATEGSDIDAVLILDELRAGDLAAYAAMLDGLPGREKACGFVSGRRELLAWEKSDLFQFYFDTTPVKGSLDALREMIDDAAVRRAVRVGACNLYHACVHNLVHEKSAEILADLYKSAAFTARAVYYAKTCRYLRSTAELTALSAPAERAVLSAAEALKRGETADLMALSETLLSWASGLIGTYREACA